MFPDLNQRTKTVLLSISVMWGQGALVNRDVWQEPRALQRVSALRSGKSKYAMSFLPRSLCTQLWKNVEMGPAGARVQDDS